MRSRMRLPLIFLVAAIAGCSVPGAQGVDPANLGAKAVLIFSVGASSTRKFSVVPEVVLKRADAPASPWRGVGAVPIGNGYTPSDFEAEYAKVVTMLVEPGQYDFFLYAAAGNAYYPNPIFTKI